MPDVRVTVKGLRWWRRGHPWIYRDDLVKAPREGAGDIVRVLGPAGEFLGQYFYNPGSKIALRLVCTEERPVDRTWWMTRLQAAIAYRARVVQESTAYRVLSSEADGFPGLIVDRYGDVLVLQCTALGMAQQLPIIVDLLKELLQPMAIVARHDMAVRALEGLPQETALLHGERPGPVEIREGEARFLVDVWTGQKTGWYLDQRENRLAAARYARGRVLDAFAYQGGFTCHVARQAEQVIALDSSVAALAALTENATRNGLTNVTTLQANAFDALKEMDRREERFDLIILDPPAFAKSRQDLAGARRGYKDLNLRALKMLTPGGHLITCSCSYNLDEATFLEILREAAADARRTARVVEVRTQAQDHPILLALPESHYLKCVVLEVVE